MPLARAESKTRNLSLGVRVFFLPLREEVLNRGDHMMHGRHLGGREQLLDGVGILKNEHAFTNVLLVAVLERESRPGDFLDDFALLAKNSDWIEAVVGSRDEPANGH